VARKFVIRVDDERKKADDFKEELGQVKSEKVSHHCRLF